MAKSKVQKMVTYLNDYEIVTYKTPIKGLYYIPVNDEFELTTFIVDVLKSENIEYCWWMNSIMFTDKYHLGYW